jgi:hypothetical protein
VSHDRDRSQFKKLRPIIDRRYFKTNAVSRGIPNRLATLAILCLPGTRRQFSNLSSKDLPRRDRQFQSILGKKMQICR